MTVDRFKPVDLRDHIAVSRGLRTCRINKSRITNHLQAPSSTNQATAPTLRPPLVPSSPRLHSLDYPLFIHYPRVYIDLKHQDPPEFTAWILAATFQPTHIVPRYFSELGLLPLIKVPTRWVREVEECCDWMFKNVRGKRPRK